MKRYLLALLLVVHTTFDPSPSPDVSHYRVEAWGRKMVPVSCKAMGITPPCFLPSLPYPVEWEVGGSPLPEGTLAAFTPFPEPGEIIYLCVRAVDTSNNESDCTGPGE